MLSLYRICATALLIAAVVYVPRLMIRIMISLHKLGFLHATRTYCYARYLLQYDCCVPLQV